MRNLHFLVYLFSSAVLFFCTLLVTQYFLFSAPSIRDEKMETQKILQGNIINLPNLNALKPTHFVNFPFLNIREEATIFSKIKGQIQNFEKVVVFRKFNYEWCEIEIPERNLRGFVACRYLSPLK